MVSTRFSTSVPAEITGPAQATSAPSLWDSDSWRLEVLTRSANEFNEQDLDKYLRMVAKVEDSPTFHSQFADYYRMYIPNEDRAPFFELLAKESVGSWEAFLLSALESVRGTQEEGKAFHASMASKLTALRFPDVPLWDVHVANFFGLAVPEKRPWDYRYHAFVGLLRRVQRTYLEWSNSEAGQEILSTVRHKYPALQGQSDARVWDLLVWNAGGSDFWWTDQ